MPHINISPFLYTPQGLYTIDNKEQIRVLFAQDNEYLLHALGYPEQLILLLPEECFDYHTLTLEWQQHTPVTITQLKYIQQQHFLRITTESKYTAIWYSVQRYDTQVHSIPTPYLLGATGYIETKLAIYMLNPSAYPLLSSRNTSLSLSCIPQSQSLIQQYAVTTGNLVIVEKKITKILVIKERIIVAVYTINTGYLELLELLAQQGITPSYTATEYTPFQKEILTKTFQDFWIPLQTWVQDCNPTTHLTIMSDVMKYPDLAGLRTSHIYTQQYCRVVPLNYGYNESCLFSYTTHLDAYSHTRSKRI